MKGNDMDIEDMQKLVEEIFSLQCQSDDASDRGDFSASASLEEQADEAEQLLNMHGYTLEEDARNLDIIHVLSDGTRMASFDLAAWQWKDAQS